MSCHSDKCHCPDCCPCPPAIVHEIGVNVRNPMCHEETPEPAYRVTSFDWHLPRSGRSGTSYAVEEVRMVATSRNIKMAEELVAKLNEHRKFKRQNDRLKDQIVALKDQIVALQAANRSVEQATKEDVRRVMLEAINRSGWPGWDTRNGHAMKKFAKRVLDTLGIRPPDEWMGLYER